MTKMNMAEAIEEWLTITDMEGMTLRAASIELTEYLRRRVSRQAAKTFFVVCSRQEGLDKVELRREQARQHKQAKRDEAKAIRLAVARLEGRTGL